MTRHDPEPVIREALPDEEARVAELLYGEPSPEAIGIAGGAELARKLALALHATGVARSREDEVHVACLHDEVVGALLARRRWGGFPVSFRTIARTVPLVFGLYAVRDLPGLARRAWLRGRLDFDIPPGSYHVVEVHVEARFRGRKIGTALLVAAEEMARRRGCAQINLTTALANRALSLYERLGYCEIGRRTLPGYEDLTGTPGRVFLAKSLATPADERGTSP